MLDTAPTASQQVRLLMAAAVLGRQSAAKVDLDQRYGS